MFVYIGQVCSIDRSEQEMRYITGGSEQHKMLKVPLDLGDVQSTFEASTVLVSFVLII